MPSRIAIGTTIVQVQEWPGMMLNYALFQAVDWDELETQLGRFERTMLANGGLIHCRWTIRDFTVLVLWYHPLDNELNPSTGESY